MQHFVKLLTDEFTANKIHNINPGGNGKMAASDLVYVVYFIYRTQSATHQARGPTGPATAREKKSVPLLPPVAPAPETRQGTRNRAAATESNTSLTGHVALDIDPNPPKRAAPPSRTGVPQLLLKAPQPSTKAAPKKKPPKKTVHDNRQPSVSAWFRSGSA